MGPLRHQLVIFVATDSRSSVPCVENEKLAVLTKERY